MTVPSKRTNRLSLTRGALLLVAVTAGGCAALLGLDDLQDRIGGADSAAEVGTSTPLPVPDAEDTDSTTPEPDAAEGDALVSDGGVDAPDARLFFEAGPSGPSCADGGVVCNGESCCTTHWVPAGSFGLGRSDAGEDRCPATESCTVHDLPEHTATLSGFWMDAYEVTVGRFRRFYDAYPASKPVFDAGAAAAIPGSGWDTYMQDALPASKDEITSRMVACTARMFTTTPQSNEDRPMNCLDWVTAFAFCAWDGGRLPTEAEWEYAAAGGEENRLYPWAGRTIDATRAVYGADAGANAPPAPVGTKPSGRGRWGHWDLAGNVFEYTLDFFSFSYYGGTGNPCTNCALVDGSSTDVWSGGVRTARGGAVGTGEGSLRNTGRIAPFQVMRENFLGFRCVKR
jgi:formylglycine-generating enzyme required for sulfatase activity